MTDHLKILPNPHRNKHYVVSLSEEITVEDQKYLLAIRYIPDKLLLDHRNIQYYLCQFSDHKTGTPESLTHDILEEIMNQIIPKWIEVNLLLKQNNPDQKIQKRKILITMEDRQPGFEDDAILGRLADIFQI